MPSTKPTSLVGFSGVEETADHPMLLREKMDSLHSKITDWKARGGGLFCCITKLDIQLEGDRGDCNEAGGTSCADQPTARYILHSEGTSYANVSLGRFVSQMQVLMKVVQLVPWRGVWVEESL